MHSGKLTAGCEVVLGALCVTEWHITISFASVFFPKQFLMWSACWNDWLADPKSCCTYCVFPSDTQLSAVPVCSSPNSLILMWSACWNEWRADVKSSFANCAFSTNTRNCQLCLNALLQTAWVLCQVRVGMTERSWCEVVWCTLCVPYWETHSNCRLFLYVRLQKVWFWFVQFVSFADWRADFKSSCAYCASPSNRKHSAVLECSSPKSLSLMSSTRWYAQCTSWARVKGSFQQCVLLQTLSAWCKGHALQT